MQQESQEISLADSLALLGESTYPESSEIQYGKVVITVAPKEGKANTLLADHIFSPSLLLAEQIERGLLSFPGKTVVELGAGCALPSLLVSTLPNAPALVVATDYPADIILSNLESNVRRNVHLVQDGCKVVSLGYSWGADTSPVVSLLPDASKGFDVVILSDLLHFDSSHGELISSLLALMGRHADARVYAAAGKYTAWNICQAFLFESSARGITWSSECSTDDPECRRWLGTLEVKGLSRESLTCRKANCWWWVGRRT